MLGQRVVYSFSGPDQIRTDTNFNKQDGPLDRTRTDMSFDYSFSSHIVFLRQISLCVPDYFLSISFLIRLRIVVHSL